MSSSSSLRASGLLSVKGAKFARRTSSDDVSSNPRERSVEPSQSSVESTVDYYASKFPPEGNIASQQEQSQPQNMHSQSRQSHPSQQPPILPPPQLSSNPALLKYLNNPNANNTHTAVSPTNSSTPRPQVVSEEATTPVPAALATCTQAENDKYWQTPSTNNDNLVIIHVCDENQQITKDFCCKRDILVNSMKYFEKFLAENENGYDDIDISVHCDVEIFEWLMTFIHESNKSQPYEIDKSIIVSILISSEFLQMDALVDLCVQNVATNLSEIIKLPIDLSCISEKLVNKIAFLTSPKILAETKDRKDKILTKLYKRRVELDFSRKGSSSSGSKTSSVRTIAASLTCCRHCGSVYLDNYVKFLNCRSSTPSIDHRGSLVARHAAIPGWSLTLYLKTLHAGGLGWDTIYWYVWASCIVFRVKDVTISALEVDRYSVEPDGLRILRSVKKEVKAQLTEDPGMESDGGSSVDSNSHIDLISNEKNDGLESFNLAWEDHCNPLYEKHTYKLKVSATISNSHGSETSLASLGSSTVSPMPHLTSTLNPMRSPEVLTSDILQLLSTQMKFITNPTHQQFILGVKRSMVETSRRNLQGSSTASTAAAAQAIAAAAAANQRVDYYDLLWGSSIDTLVPGPSLGSGGGDGSETNNGSDSNGYTRRGRSPVPPMRGLRSASVESRNNPSNKMAKARSGATLAGNAPGVASVNGGSGGLNSMSTDVGASGADHSNRRALSVGHGRKTGVAVGVGGENSVTLPPRPGGKKLNSSNDRRGGSNSSHASRNSGLLRSATNKIDGDELFAHLDRATQKRIGILLDMPAPLDQRFVLNKGFLQGIWLEPHPLQFQSGAQLDAVQAVTDSPLSHNKKLEWELDILREHDERRMDRFAQFLIARRTTTSFNNVQNSVPSAATRAGSVTISSSGTGARKMSTMPSNSSGQANTSTGSNNRSGNSTNAPGIILDPEQMKMFTYSRKTGEYYKYRDKRR